MLWMSLVRPASPHKCGWQVVACLLQYSARRRPSAAKVLASTQVARSQQQEQPPAPADYEAVQLLKTIRVSHMLSNIRLRLAYLNSMAMQDPPPDWLHDVQLMVQNPEHVMALHVACA